MFVLDAWGFNLESESLRDLHTRCWFLKTLFNVCHFYVTRFCTLRKPFRKNLHVCRSVAELSVLQKWCTRKEGPTEAKWMCFCVAPVDCQSCNSTIIKGFQFFSQKGSSSLCAFESDVSVCACVSVTCSLQAAAQ